MSGPRVPEWVEYEVKCPHCQVWFTPTSNPRMTSERVQALEAERDALLAVVEAARELLAGIGTATSLGIEPTYSSADLAGRIRDLDVALAALDEGKEGT